MKNYQYIPILLFFLIILSKLESRGEAIFDYISCFFIGTIIGGIMDWLLKKDEK